MNTEQLNVILATLREQMVSASIEEFDSMLDAQAALQEWHKGGASGEMPFAAELRGWGIDVPDVAVSLAPTPDEVAGMVERLRTLLINGHPESDAIRDAFREVWQWQANGMNGPLPQAEQLAKWGVCPPRVASSTNGASTRAHRTGPSVVHTAPQPSLGEMSPLTRPLPPDPPPASDPDDQFQYRYEDGLAALRNGDYYQARVILQELKDQVYSRLAQPVDKAYFEASNKLQARTFSLVQAAQNAERRFKNDRQRQRLAWDEVLKVNPESEEANQALARLARAQADRELAGKLDDILARASTAARNDQLPALNQLLGQVESWKALGEKEPPEISQPLYQRVVELEKQVRKLRQETRGRLGESSTLLATGDFREAYKRGRDLFERAVPKIVDVAGLFGPVGEEVDTASFFSVARERFLPALRSLVAQRLQQAEGQERQNPEQALETLQDAIARLTDEVLTSDDKAELKPDLKPLEEKRREIERRLEKYKEAKAKVALARSPDKTRAQALDLFLQVKEEYPDYPNLEIYIERAREDVANVVASKVKNAIAVAQRQKERDQYDMALKTLADVRSQATQQVPNPKPDSELRQRLAEVAALEQEVAQAERAYMQMMDLLSEVDQAIKRFNEGHSRALRSAENFLNQFNEQERRHKEVRKRLAAVTDRQDDMEKWRSGQAEYNKQNWQSAEAILRQVARGDTSNKEEAKCLADRALACHYAEEAKQAEQESNWKTARQSYQQAISLLQAVGTDGLTTPMLQQCHDALNRLAPLVESDQEVQKSLSQARRLYQIAQEQVNNQSYLWLEPIPEFAMAVTRLEKVRQRPSTLNAEVNTLLQEIQRNWRQAYLKAMQAALGTSDVEMAQKGVALAEELGSANLLFERKDKQLARDLTLKVLDNEYQQLQLEVPVPWHKIEENRQKRRTVQPTPEVEAAYRQAVRKRILANVDELKGQNLAIAKKYLVQELEQPAQRADKALVALLIELCWQLSDWHEAERRATELGYHARAWGEVWSALTRAARWFKAGMVEPGHAELQVIREQYQDVPELQQLITSKKRLFIEEARDQLLRQAADAFAQQTDEGYLEAATKYAQAAELAGDDPRIIIGLQQLGHQLGSAIPQRSAQARAFTIGQRRLANAVQEMARLHTTLTAIQKVGDKLHLDSELMDELEETIEVITPKYQRWQAVQNNLKNASEAIEEALQHPLPLSADGYGSGGWDFNRARHVLQQAQLAARGDRECPQRVQKVLDRLANLEEKAHQLETQINLFMEALRTEDFDRIPQEANQLAILWRRCQQAPWGGLNRLIAYHYPWYGRQIDTLDEHKRLTVERQANWQEWEDWSQAVQKSYHDAKKAGQEMIKGLDELRYKYSLAQIIPLCDKCIEACEEFEGQAYSSPQREPLSQKAQAARDRILIESWTNEMVTKYQAKAMEMKEQALADRKKLTARDGALTHLSRVMEAQIRPQIRKGKVFEKSLQQAQKLLDQCDKIDPLNQQVGRYRKTIEKLMKKAPRQNPSPSLWNRLLGR